jgi:hypothetical protein
MSSALTKSEQESVTASCSGTGRFLKLWRFETDISFDNCLREGVCDFKVLPFSTACTTADLIPQYVPS